MLCFLFLHTNVAVAIYHIFSFTGFTAKGRKGILIVRFHIILILIPGPAMSDSPKRRNLIVSVMPLSPHHFGAHEFDFCLRHPIFCLPNS